MSADVLTIISNFVFLVPMVEAFRRHRWTRAMIYASIIVFSSMYHACNSYRDRCVFDANFHRQLDFFFAQFVIPATALYIICFPHGWEFLERILLILFVVAIVLVQATMGEVFVAQLGITAVAFGFIVLYWVGYAIWKWMNKKKLGVSDNDGDNKYRYLPDYHWEPFAWGIALTGVASALFATELQNHNLYWAVHACWHSLAAMGQYFILQIKQAAPRYANMDAVIQNKAVSRWAMHELEKDPSHQHLLWHRTPKARV